MRGEEQEQQINASVERESGGQAVGNRRSPSLVSICTAVQKGTWSVSAHTQVGALLFVRGMCVHL